MLFKFVAAIREVMTLRTAAVKVSHPRPECEAAYTVISSHNLVDEEVPAHVMRPDSQRCVQQQHTVLRPFRQISTPQISSEGDARRS